MDARFRPLSIGIVSASLSRAAGGILPIMLGHARELAKLGTTVSAYGVGDAFSGVDAPSWAPVPCKIYNARLSKFAYAPELGPALARSGHDILHQHGLWLYPSIAISRWRWQTGRPVVISTQGMLEPWALSNSRLKKKIALRLFERANLNHAACIHCSDGEVAGIMSLGLSTPIAVLPNGIETVSPSPRPRRPRWLPDDGRRTLLYLGRLHPKKGLQETLEAWKILSTLNPWFLHNWRLVIAGWGAEDYARALATGASALGVNNIILPGPLYGEEKEAALANADAFILASYSEGLPMAVLEAWSHELPVFMTEACNLSEGFAARAAIRITTDPTEIADALSRYLGSQESEEMGTRGRLLVEEHFSWPKIARELLSVYQWLTGGGDKPDCVMVPRSGIKRVAVT